MAEQQPVSYLQTDARWKNINYSAPGESTTVGKAGCGPASMAMVIATWADPAVTPAVTAVWSLDHGYKAKNQGTYYSYFKPQGAAYGLTAEQLNGSSLRNMTAAEAGPYHEKALASVRAGDYAICCMGPGNWTSSGHFVLWWNESGGTVRINDPAGNRAGRIRAPLTLLQSEVKYYFLCRRPEKKEETAVESVKSQPAAWAKEAAEWAVKNGIVRGDGTGDMHWQDPMTREIFAVMLKRYYDQMKK